MTASFISDFTHLVAGLADEKSLAAALVEARTAHRARWAPDTGGRGWMNQNAALLDEALRRIFALASQRTKNENSSETLPDVAVVAVGGYGQKLLAPHSDVDLAFVTERDDNSAFLHTLFQITMDVLVSGAKLKIGYSYRTLGEISPPDGLSALDHQSQTALLDARLVAGAASLFPSFEQQIQKNLHLADFLFRKEAERTLVRSAGGTASPRQTTPNVKEGPGGLRDMQSAFWMARVRWRVSKGEGVGRDLVRRKIITPTDWQNVQTAREFLLTVRCALHLSAGERREILTAPRQEAVARLMNFADRLEGSLVRPGVEIFMARYYECAAQSDTLWHKISTRCMDAPLPLGQNAPGLSCAYGRVSLTDPQQAAQNPLWPLSALEFCQAHDLELAPRLCEAVQIFRAGEGWKDAAQHPEAGERFTRLLSSPGAAGKTVRRMDNIGILADFLPDLAACMNLIPYDPTHTSTVGEHSIRVLENLIGLRDAAPTDETLPYHAALRDLDNAAPLFLAALLHDVGKNHESGDDPALGHAELGARRMQAACARLHLPAKMAGDVQFLVRNHLLLAEVSRLRDLSLPQTVHAVADIVETPARLRLLFLLTWADTQAVGPGVWNARFNLLLLELYERVEAQFAAPDGGPAARADNPERLSAVRQRLQRTLSPAPSLAPPRDAPDRAGTAAVSPESVRQHTEIMPAAYLLGTPPDTIALHLHLIKTWEQAGMLAPVFDMRVAAPNLPQTALTLVTSDDPAPGLLAKITGVLLALDIRLHAAQVWTRPTFDNNTESGIVLDTLFVDFHDKPLGPHLRRTVADALTSVLTNEVTVADLLQQKRKAVEAGLPPFRVMQQGDFVAPDYTLLDVEAPDDKGTLYRFAAAFAHRGWHIRVARVSRWGGKARYAFYLSGSNAAADFHLDLTALAAAAQTK